MALHVFLAVLGAALLHAGWNALVRVGSDRLTSMVLLSMGQSVICLPLIFLFPAPAAASLPWLFISVIIHTAYKMSLVAAYRTGELSQVYPLARGTAPLIVTVIAAVFLGEVLAPDDWAAVACIALGVVAMSMGGRSLGRLPRSALLYALTTACMTAGYTLTDGYGARASGSASGYAVWLLFLDGLVMYGVVAAWRGGGIFGAVRNEWRGGLLAGAMSLASYWVAIWAFTQAPIALVGALRETSVLFAMLIGAILIKERTGPWRWGAAGLILAGVLILRV